MFRQIELTNAMFNLSVDDIIELHDAGVNATIIRAMQERRDGNTATTPLHPDRRTEWAGCGQRQRIA